MAATQDFESFYGDELLLLSRLAYLMTGDVATGEDLAQETLARMSERWDGIETPKAYARTTLTRLVLRWRQMADRLQPMVEHDIPANDEPEIDEMWSALRSLPLNQRVVLVLRYYDDLPHEQIAELVGAPVATVRTRVHRGLERLRGELRP